MSLGTGALKVSGVPDTIAARGYTWQPWNAGTTQNERPLTGTVTLKISGNNLPEKILTLATKCRRGREERVQESAMIRNS